jgi:predicted lipoprotein with Yx(FWY)xxD motif
VNRSARSALAAGLAIAFTCGGAFAKSDDVTPSHPPNVTIVKTELEGPVFADERGHTLYTWYGDKERDKSDCKDVKYTTATGGSGLTYQLAEPETRMTCRQAWPPLAAGVDAQPTGPWGIFTRDDGVRQWSYAGKPVYTSSLDRAPGDVNGVGMGRWTMRQGRTPLHVIPGAPPGISSAMTEQGRAFAVDRGNSLLFVKTKAEACREVCEDGAWRPFVAPSLADSHGDWSVVEDGRARQWAYKGKPLYTFVPQHPGQKPDEAFDPGWRPAVFTDLPPRPRDITVQMTSAGETYADKDGRSLYLFDCNEEAPDRLLCDVEGATPRYRLGLCGGPEKCAQVYQPLLARKGARSPGRTWTVVKVDQVTGAVLPKEAKDGAAVWAYRGRPVYTYVGDKGPGDTNGDGRQLFFMGAYEVVTVNSGSSEF